MTRAPLCSACGHPIGYARLENGAEVPVHPIPWRLFALERTAEPMVSRVTNYVHGHVGHAAVCPGWQREPWGEHLARLGLELAAVATLSCAMAVMPMVARDVLRGYVEGACAVP